MKIKEKREELGLTMKELSEALEIPYRTLQDWEAGRRNPAPWAEKLILKEMDRMKK